MHDFVSGSGVKNLIAQSREDDYAAVIERIYRNWLQDGLFPHHYKLRAEVPLGMTAKRFFDETQSD